MNTAEVQKEEIRSMLRSLDLAAGEDAVQKLFSYYEMLTERNRVMNLTAITAFEDVVEKHYADSLLITRVISMNGVSDVIDIGTGAGFPGIPLKILFPQMRLTLLDSLQKRIGFLDDVIRELKLTDVQTVHGRAEDIGKDPAFRAQYDLCVSRAVANLSVLSELCLPFVKTGGRFVSYKSAGAAEEIRAAEKAVSLLGGGQPDIMQASLPRSGQERLFVCIRKISVTPGKYPRKAGTPARKPLGD